MLIFSSGGYAQITLDYQTFNADWSYFKLNDFKTVYWFPNITEINSQHQFSLYNIDGTLYKTIQLPADPDTTAYVESIGNVSESLFDNDPTNIEYIMSYRVDSLVSWLPSYRTKVVREDNTILLDEMFARFANVFPTEEGAKLWLSYVYAVNPYTHYQIKVFNIPGVIPTAVSENENILGNEPTLYPNPNAGSFVIDLHSKQGNISTINLFSQDGKLINSFISNENPIKISNPGLSDGMYFLNARSQNSFSKCKMIIKK